MKRYLLGLLFLAICGGAVAQSQPNWRTDSTNRDRCDSLLRPAPMYIDGRVLAANVSETHTIPSGAKCVVFSADCNFSAKPGASAAVLAADVTDGTGSEINPKAWRIWGGMTQISVIAASACKVSLSFYLD